MIDFIMNELKIVVQDFYNATNVMCVIYDDRQTVVYSYPPQLSSFCTYVRTCNALKEECLRCDRQGFRIVNQTQKTCLYKCHMNLTEAITPIFDNKKIIGYMMLGEVIKQKDYNKAQRKVSEACQNGTLNKNEAINKLKDVSVITDIQMKAAVNIMNICAKHLYYDKILRYRNDPLSAKVKEYLETHYCEKISINTICAALYVSESKLYAISKDLFGIGASEYIRELKMNEAKRLLDETDYNINEITERVGYSDANYFIRLFKKLNGTTPTAYRRNLQKIKQNDL